jgi:hypothetical protein
MPTNLPMENASSQPTATRRHSPVRVVLPLGQLVLCAVLLVMACGPESLMPVSTGAGTIYVGAKGVFTGCPAIHARQPHQT